MKKFLFLILVALALPGCGSSVTSREAIDLQKSKELDVIEAQKEKEKEVLDHQYELRAKESADKQTLVDGCIEDAQIQRKKTLTAVLGSYGISSEATPEQMTSEQDAYCLNKYGKNLDARLVCVTTFGGLLKEIASDYKKAEADCYARYK